MTPEDKVIIKKVVEYLETRMQYFHDVRSEYIENPVSRERVNKLFQEIQELLK